MDRQFKRQLQNTRKAASVLAGLSFEMRNQLLLDLQHALLGATADILAANERDFAKLSKNYEMADRLRLTKERIVSMAEGVAAVAKLPDPLGVTLEKRVMPNGLKIQRVSVPIGVLGIIYEARPNVTVDIVALALKSGNAAVLKGGSDAWATNQTLGHVIHKVLQKHNLAPEAILLVNPTEPALVASMMKAHGLIDVLIPRGGQGLIDYVRKSARIPVIETGAGVCHIYVEASANLSWAADSIINAKTRRPSVCNALDTLVIDKKIVAALLHNVALKLVKHNVLIHADQVSYSILQKLYPNALLQKVTAKDYGKEFLGLEMAIKVVNGFDQGLAHVMRYTSHHSEAIITNTKRLADQFVRSVDAAAVYINAPTSFTDGFEFGLGAEVGISTQKLHARGPMGLSALTSYKWIIEGQGQIRPV